MKGTLSKFLPFKLPCSRLLGKKCVIGKDEDVHRLQHHDLVEHFTPSPYMTTNSMRKSKKQ